MSSQTFIIELEKRFTTNEGEEVFRFVLSANWPKLGTKAATNDYWDHIFIFYCIRLPNPRLSL